MVKNLPDLSEAGVLTPEERLAFEAAWAAWWQDVQLLDTTARGFFGMAWRAAKAYVAFREQEHQQAAEAEVPWRCPWCDCEGQVSRTWDRAEPCWRCGSCHAVWVLRAEKGAS